MVVNRKKPTKEVKGLVEKARRNADKYGQLCVGKIEIKDYSEIWRFFEYAGRSVQGDGI